MGKHLTKTSIVAGAMARQALANLQQSNMQRMGYAKMGKLSLFIRLCVRNGVPSGGAYLMVESEPPMYASVPSKRHKYVKRSDLDTLYRHAADLVEQERRAVADLIRKQREIVYELAERKEFDADAAELLGHEIMYEKMSENDCKFWMNWLRECQDKQTKEEL